MVVHSVFGKLLVTSVKLCLWQHCLWFYQRVTEYRQNRQKSALVLYFKFEKKVPPVLVWQLIDRNIDDDTILRARKEKLLEVSMKIILLHYNSLTSDIWECHFLPSILLLLKSFCFPMNEKSVDSLCEKFLILAAC